MFTVVTTRVSKDMQRFRTEEGAADDPTHPYGPLKLHVLVASETATKAEKEGFLHAFAACLPRDAVKEIRSVIRRPHQ